MAGPDATPRLEGYRIAESIFLNPGDKVTLGTKLRDGFVTLGELQVLGDGTVLWTDAATGQAYDLSRVLTSQPEVIVGKEPPPGKGIQLSGADVVTVSRRHLKIHMRGLQAVVTDISMNGTVLLTHPSEKKASSAVPEGATQVETVEGVSQGARRNLLQIASNTDADALARAVDRSGPVRS